MPQLKTLFTISLRCVARKIKKFWKKEWDPELEKVTELSDEILLRLRKNYILEYIRAFIIVHFYFICTILKLIIHHNICYLCCHTLYTL